MIADYLYNTPSLTTETGAFVLLTQQFANVAALNSALLGKTLAQIREMTSVLGTADTEVKQFGFLQRRNPSSVYAGSTILPNFTVPTSAKFNIARGGTCQTLAMIILKDGVCLRAVSMALRLDVAAEVSATRVVFSVDDDFVSAIEGPLGVGLMLGNASEVMVNNVPATSATLVGVPVGEVMVNNVPIVSTTLTSLPVDEVMVNAVSVVLTTLTSLPVQKALNNNVPTTT